MDELEADEEALDGSMFDPTYQSIGVIAEEEMRMEETRQSDWDSQ